MVTFLPFPINKIHGVHNCVGGRRLWCKTKLIPMKNIITVKMVIDPIDD